MLSWHKDYVKGPFSFTKLGLIIVKDCLKEAFNIDEIKDISFEQGQTFSKNTDYLSLVIEYEV